MSFWKNLLGKPSHIASQRKGLIGLAQDAIDVSSRQGTSQASKSSESTSSAPTVSASNQRKLDRVDDLDRKAGEALARGDKKEWERLSQMAQDEDDLIR